MKSGSNLETVLEAGHFAVTAEIGPPMDCNAEEVVKKEIEKRKIEIAAEAEAEGFVVLKEEIERDIAYYGVTHHRYGGFYIGRAYPYHSYLGVGTTNLTPRKTYTGHLRIRLFHQQAPEGLGPAYDAHTVIEVLGPKIFPPEPG